MTFEVKRKAAEDGLALAALAEIEDTVEGAFADLAAGRASYKMLEATVERVAGILARTFEEMGIASNVEGYESWGLAQESPPPE